MSFDPWNSYVFPEIDTASNGFDHVDNPPDAEGDSSSSSSSTEEESEVPVAVSEDSCLTASDIRSAKAVIASRTGYLHDRTLSRHLHDVPGLIILPLWAISYLRTPQGEHKRNPQILLYFWNPENCQNYNDLNNCLDCFYAPP